MVRVGSIATVLFCGAACLAGEAMELKAKFPPGRTRYVESKREMTQKIKSPMGNMAFDIKILNGHLEKVESGAGGGGKVLVTFDRMKFEMDMPGAAMTYDTDMAEIDEAPMIKPVADAMIGGEVTLEFDKDGKTKSASGGDKLIETMGKKAGTANQFFNGMKEHFSTEALKSEMGDGPFRVLPSKKVAVGDKWKNSYEEKMPQMGTFKIDLDCVLEKVSEEGGKKVAVIGYTGKMTMKEAGQTMMGPMDLESGTLKGTVWFAISEGEVVKSESQGNIKMSGKSPAGDDDDENAKDEKDAKDTKDEKKSAEPAVGFEMSFKELTTVRTPSERAKEKKENGEKAKKAAAEEEDDDEDD